MAASTIDEPASEPKDPSQRRDLLEQAAELSAALDRALTHYRDNPSTREQLLDDWTGITFTDLLRAGKLTPWNQYISLRAPFSKIANDLSTVMLSQSRIRKAILQFCFIGEKHPKKDIKRQLEELFASYLMDLHIEAGHFLRHPGKELDYFSKLGDRLRLNMSDTTPSEFVEKISEANHNASIPTWTLRPKREVRRIQDRKVGEEMRRIEETRRIEEMRKVAKGDFILNSRALQVFKDGLIALRKPLILPEAIDLC
ncbi:hypothetical protein EG329_011941 [Mollisiaceae sp. DMI_Dod_QoI]|nr:hypothetical protein EG329_011941 [Helotiales sp. DMI_Dod_QoI]